MMMMMRRWRQMLLLQFVAAIAAGNLVMVVIIIVSAGHCDAGERQGTNGWQAIGQGADQKEQREGEEQEETNCSCGR